MKDSGTRIFFVILFFVVSVYYLFPTAQQYFLKLEREALAEDQVEAWQADNHDRIQRVADGALSLGLDLQGGMHVVLEVRVDALLRELATDTDANFEAALASARAAALKGSDNFIAAFRTAFEAGDPEARLSRYFRNGGAGIGRRSTNDEVVQFLNAQSTDAIERAISIIRDRVDRFGVTEPSIQKQGTRRIVVELPGVTDTERVRSLLKGTALLEFRLMADPGELMSSLQQIYGYYNVEVDSTESDTTDLDNLLDDTAPAITNTLAEVLSPAQQIGTTLGFANVLDTAKVNMLLADPNVQAMLPLNIIPMWTSAGFTTEDGETLFTLLGVRADRELTGESITEANVDFDQLSNQPEVVMVMDAEGSRVWARVTGANIGKQVAIVLDNVVYSYPNVNGKIVGGRSSITGLDSRAEAEDIVTVLKSGALPAPVDIVEERTVGPSLGAASVKAGVLALLFGFTLVVVFMVVYYQGAGIVANIALITNIIFIFGILAAFHATLTLPGVAGIVLTIGMAVDANVLIFERIREERTSGKGLAASIDGGFAKAFSAIADANITTFFVGLILYSFGIGPIQGFAVTLMAGIVSSVFTAIVISRITLDYLVSEKRKDVSFG